MPKTDTRTEYRAADRGSVTRPGPARNPNEVPPRRPRREPPYAPETQPAAEGTDDDDAPLIPRRIGRKEIINFTSELAVMVDTGINLSAALGHVIEQAENPSLARIARELKAAVESGEDFSTALSRHPKLFDKVYVQLVRASEVSGSLGSMLDRVVEEGRRDYDSRGKVRAALAYPAVMLFASISSSVFLLTYVFPKFATIFSGRGITLPLPTRIMMAVSNSLIYYWYVGVLGVVLLAAALTWLWKSTSGRQFLDGVKLNLPILGVMFRNAALSRSLRTLSTMLSSGVPMLQAIRLCGDVSGNTMYEQDWIKVADGVAEGRQIHELIATSPRFPKSLAQMIAAGEQTGRLGSILTRLSDYYDRELELSLKTVTSMIEPIMVCFMGFVVGSIAMALLLPIFTLSRHVG
ncbi:MAG: type II secretion system F family protein [Planctomycetes bacterium]|nr:type II secretion system F family protein [Planctomycetota bacterium]